MKIKDTVKLGGHQVQVKRVSVHMLPEYELGICDVGRCMIKIQSQLPPTREQEVFFHELVEWANSSFELNMDHWKIQVLGEFLFQVFAENFDDNGEEE